jgi:hypothetical protein
MFIVRLENRIYKNLKTLALKDIIKNNESDKSNVDNLSYNYNSETNIVYFPAYKITYNSSDYKFFKLINGYNGTIHGYNIYDPMKIFGLSTVAGGFFSGVSLYTIPTILLPQLFLCKGVLISIVLIATRLSTINKDVKCEMEYNKRFLKNNKFSKLEDNTKLISKQSE